MPWVTPELYTIVRVQNVSPEFAGQWVEVKFEVVQREDASGEFFLRVPSSHASLYRPGDVHVLHLVKIPNTNVGWQREPT